MKLWRHRARWILISGLISVLTLVLTAPAAVMALLIETMTGGRLQAVRTQGSAWNGGAMLLAGPAQRFSVTWRIDLSRWYQAEVGWIIEIPTQSLRLSANPGHWAAESDGIALPVVALRPFLPGSVANYGWSGEVRLSARKFGRSWWGNGWGGSARVELQSLGVRELYSEPLGSFGIAVKPADTGLELVLATLSGPLFLDARANWMNQKFTCAGEASLTPGTAVDVGRLIDHFARRVAPGKWGFACPS